MLCSCVPCLVALTGIPHSVQFMLGSSLCTSKVNFKLDRTTDFTMKFLKIFKKKSPTPLPTSNLICNIHWAEVQRELSQEIKETSISKPVVNNKNVSHFAPAPVNHGNCWSSDSSNTNSNSRHSWSSVSLSSSTKTTSAEPFPEENFSR